MPIRGVGILGNPPDNNRGNLKMNQHKLDHLLMKERIVKEHMIALCVMLRDDMKFGMNLNFIEKRIARAVYELDEIKNEQAMMVCEHFGVL